MGLQQYDINIVGKLRKAYEAWWDENKPEYLPKDVANY